MARKKEFDCETKRHCFELPAEYDKKIKLLEYHLSCNKPRAIAKAIDIAIESFDGSDIG